MLQLVRLEKSRLSKVAIENISDTPEDLEPDWEVDPSVLDILEKIGVPSRVKNSIAEGILGVRAVRYVDEMLGCEAVLVETLTDRWNRPRSMCTIDTVFFRNKGDLHRYPDWEVSLFYIDDALFRQTLVVRCRRVRLWCGAQRPAAREACHSKAVQRELGHCVGRFAVRGQGAHRSPAPQRCAGEGT